MDKNTLTILAPLEVKEASVEDGGARTLTAWASTDDLDEVDDIVEPGAFEKTLPQFKQFPRFFAFHDPHRPIGIVTEAVIQTAGEKRGLLYRATFADTMDGKDMFRLAQMGALWSSIGYKATKFSFEKKGDKRVRRISELFLGEISLTSIPANPHANVVSVEGKSLLGVGAQVKAWAARLASEDREPEPAPEQGRPLEGEVAMLLAASAAAAARAVATAITLRRGV